MPSTLTDNARVVAEDLAWLRDEWDEEVEPSSLRRSSTVLRRLLVEASYPRAWREVGLPRTPRLRGTDLRALVERKQGIASGTWWVAGAAGGSYHGLEVDGYALTAKYLGPAPPGGPSHVHLFRGKATSSEEAGIELVELNVYRFLDAPSVITSAGSVPRRTVVSFVANKLGGAHHDTRRTKGGPERLLEQVAELILLGPEGLELNIVYFELLSIGQALARSDDAQRFAARCVALERGEPPPPAS